MEYWKLSVYAEKLEKEGMLAGAEPGVDPQIHYLTYDSRAVVPGTLFICKGVAFKAEYLQDATAAGAVAYVAEKTYDLEEDVPHLLVKNIREAMPVLAELYTKYVTSRREADA